MSDMDEVRARNAAMVRSLQEVEAMVERGEVDAMVAIWVKAGGEPIGFLSMGHPLIVDGLILNTFRIRHGASLQEVPSIMAETRQ